MAEVWELPDLDCLKPTGPNWFLNLLHAIPENQRAMVLLTVWRTWHAHNELTHDKPCPSIEGSRRFLVSYLNSLLIIKQFPHADVTKGKMVVDHNRGFVKIRHNKNERQNDRPKWIPPSANVAKLNVDGAFAGKGHAGCGMILRDQKGDVIYVACR
jgi:hypothetical protein